MTTQIVKMNVNKVVAGNQIAAMLKEYAGSTSMAITIGISEDGDIEKWHNVHGFEGMAVELFNTENGFEGFDVDPADWDSEDEYAIARLFEDTWIQDAINNANREEDYIEIIWP